MRILIVKTSSLGDVLHTLPALTDAARHLPDARFDWLVEEAFAEIPLWHRAVAEVIPINLRQWRKHPWLTWRSGTWANFRANLRRCHYDYVIDAQGLLKSALLGVQARGTRLGLDWQSAREAPAAWFYQKKYPVPRRQHAIERVRQLFALALDYPVPQNKADYGINRYMMTTFFGGKPSLVFLHGTTWDSKHWPLVYWGDLALRAAQAGYRVRLPWGNLDERRRAEAIARAHKDIGLIPAGNLQELAAELSVADAVVGVDTGLVHLAAALDVPSVTMYGPTNPGLTGTLGRHQVHLQAQLPCSPCLKRECTYPGESRVTPACFEEITPERVWQKLTRVIQESKR